MPPLLFLGDAVLQYSCSETVQIRSCVGFCHRNGVGLGELLLWGEDPKGGVLVSRRLTYVYDGTIPV